MRRWWPLLVVVLAVGLSSIARATVVPGGGPPTTDCYGAFDVQGADGSSKRVICVDGDPACDVDGACQGLCTFELAVCLHQLGVAGCTPTPLAKPATVRGAALPVPSSSDTAAICAEPGHVEVVLRGRRRSRPRKKRLTLVVNTTGGPARDRDVAVLRCEPRRDGPCPTTTTITTTSTTTTTTMLAPRGAAGTTLYAIAPGNLLLRFNSADPSVVTEIGVVSGLGAGETIRGIAVRPRTGQLVAGAVTSGAAANSVVRTYRVDPTSGTATLVGQTAAALPGAGDVPTGYDFVPTTDRIRYVTTNDENARMNPNNGALAGNDTDLTPATVAVIAAACDRSFDRQVVTAPVPNGVLPTTIYVIDRAASALARLGGVDGSPSPNGGIVTVVGPLGFTLNATRDGGFDIAPGIDGARVFAALTDTADDLTRLYRIDLATGMATAVGLIGDGMREVRGLAIASEGLTVVGADAGGEARVRVFEAPGGAPVFSFLPYGSTFTGGVRVAAGDITGDGVPDLVTTPGAGMASLVRVFDGATGEAVAGALGGFLAYDAGFTGGAFVAAGDVNGDGFDDIVTGAGPGAGPHVRVFSGRDGAQLLSFFAYAGGFTGGVYVGAGDNDLDGLAELITGPGMGGAPEIHVFSGSDGTDVLPPFLAFASGFLGGVHVALGDVDGDGPADIIAGAGPGGGPDVRIFGGLDGTPVASFFAFPADFAGGVRVSSGDLDGDGQADILAAPGPAGAPQVKAFDGVTLAEVGSVPAFAADFTGGVFVAGARQ